MGSRIYTQITFTTITSVVIVSGILLLNGVISRRYGIGALGEYLLMRRIAFALVPVSLYGVGITIPRFLGMQRDRPQLRPHILRWGLTIFAALGLPTIMLLVIGLYWAPIGIDSQTVISRAALPIGLLGAGVSVHQLAYSYFRGLRLMARANALHLANIGLLPIVIILSFPKIPILSIVAIHGLAVLLITLVTLAKPLTRAIRIKPHTGDHSLRREFNSYALRRLGASWGMLALLVLGPLIMAYLGTWQEVAIFSVGMQVNRLFFVILGPIGIVMLPTLSYYASKEASTPVRQGIRALYLGGIALGMYVTCHLWFFAEPLLMTWLGEASQDGVRLFRLFSLSLTGYLLFELSRNPIDAFAKTGYNSRNIIAGLACIVAVAAILVGVFHYPVWQGVTLGYVVGFWVLGLLSVGTCVRLYGITWFEPRFFIQTAGLNALIITLLWTVMQYWLVAPPLKLIAALELLSILGYIAGLFWLKQEWLTILRSKGSMATGAER